MTLACTRVPCSRAAKSIIHGKIRFSVLPLCTHGSLYCIHQAEVDVQGKKSIDTKAQKLLRPVLESAAQGLSRSIFLVKIQVHSNLGRHY